MTEKGMRSHLYKIQWTFEKHIGFFFRKGSKRRAMFASGKMERAQEVVKWQ